ncbi:helix-turn-helix transcriptional regulator [Streptomyces sp. NPDC056401]|uniref:helix-turn-helix transcriptional regulator n=1 Tax=Streptomyces sp. NPDC056401 TaxID=3345809 RepID=UPI0035D9E0DB
MMSPWDLFERESELTVLSRALKTAGSGSGGFTVVTGSAGIGKSRLLASVRETARTDGQRVLSARGSELERDFAFGVVRQLFEAMLADADAGERAALLAGPAAQAAEVFTGFGSSAGDFAVLHGLYWLTANGCESESLVLLVDDLQWCDTPSLRFLAHLLPRLEGLGLLVVAGLRTHEVGTDEHLLRQITADPAVTLVRPAALSRAATAALLARALDGSVDPAFATACHRATGGNPLLLRELARTISARGVLPNAVNARRVVDLGPHAVAPLVADRMARLPGASVALARAVAVLGDGAGLGTAAELADQELLAASSAATGLKQLEILHTESATAMPTLGFVHPLVRAAVYEAIDPVERATSHARAARLLTTAGAGHQQVAAHLLRVAPARDPATVTVLRAAAADSARRGSPDGAYAYLRRCLSEPPPADQRLDVLLALGEAASYVDVQAAAQYQQEAYDQLTDPVQRAQVATVLGTIYSLLSELDRSVALLAAAETEAEQRLPAGKEDLTRQLQAGLLTALALSPGRYGCAQQLERLRRLPPHDSIGGRLLDCVIAYCDLTVRDPEAVSRARRALRDGSLVARAGGESALFLAWVVLLDADDHDAMGSIQDAFEHAHHHGSIRSLWAAHHFRAAGWLWRGQLAEAELDQRESLRLAELGRVEFGRQLSSAQLALILMEQGRLDEAEQILRSNAAPAVPRMPGDFLTLEVLARVQRRNGDLQGALRTALTSGQGWAAHDLREPVWTFWRSESALCLKALGRHEEAAAYAADDLRLAEQWQAPRTLGRSLRINALLHGTGEGLDLLHRAVAVLEPSPARLEYAKALADLGAALRRAGRRVQARDPLRRALDLATTCGATPLADRAREELLAAGARPRRSTLTGPHSLTPSEQRVARLAATQATNREIAQALFITPKTVEVHLGRIYRKLGITTRTQLADALDVRATTSDSTP